MRLINTATRELEEFIGQKIPKYAILSHTWEEEEVSYQDYMRGKHLKSRMKGFEKIDRTCRLAVDDDIEYAWVDTCCIDKRSSAELTEAINSMFRWYERAEVCYAFLSDIGDELDDEELDAAVRGCRWFTRGWTLQELIAPRNLCFINSEWNRIGSKDDLTSLSAFTGIPAGVLSRVTPLSSVLVAQKMSWASKRVTTRIEDTAYCLLGLFGVNIPLLYGEEENAFLRLQEEIIRTTPDLSIFAWRMVPSLQNPMHDRSMYCGVLAEAPSYFSGCGASPVSISRHNVEFSLTNNGVRIASTLSTFEINEDRNSCYILPMPYRYEPTVFLAVMLRKVGHNQFLRSYPWQLKTMDSTVHSSLPVLHGTHYLLLKPPDLHHQVLDAKSPAIPPKWITDEQIATARVLTIGIKSHRNITFYEIIPDSRFDRHDMTFFSHDTSDAENHWGTFRIIANHFGTKAKPVHCIFYYAFTKLGFQGSLVSHEDYAKAIGDIASEIAARNVNTDTFLHLLQRHEIPRISTVTFPSPGSVMVIAYTYESFVREGKHGEFSFSYDTYRVGTALFIPQKKNWRLPWVDEGLPEKDCESVARCPRDIGVE